MEPFIYDMFNQTPINEAVERFHLSSQSLKLISDSESFIFEAKLGNHEVILRVTHSSHRSETELLGELEWIDFLKQHGVHTSQPLRSKNNRWRDVIE